MGSMIFLLCLATPDMDLTTRIFLHDLSYFLQPYLSKITQTRNQQQKVLNRKKKGYPSLFLQLAFPLVG